ncbi:MAG: hypothetical protein J1F29_07930, partial [Lentimicrobiaceae bacterium]|nr:hypothetical protein [Lentimicrobiaceae bacterium]
NFSDLRIQLIEVFQFEVLQRSKLLSTVFYLSVGTKIQKLRAKTKFIWFGFAVLAEPSLLEV